MKSEGPSRLRLCLLNCSLAPAFRGMGHEVLDLRPRPGVTDLPLLLHEHGFTPDMVVQQETLGPRILLRGLESLSCPRVFWSVDSHLNAFWHQEYAHLFDLTLSTQKHWAEELRDQGACRTAWLPWYGRRLSWVPWKNRKQRISFVGRVTEHRPSRNRFVAFLKEQFGLQPVQDVSFEDMLTIYGQTWLVPNETICGEINFRLFEAASSGCLVFNLAGISGLEEILTPGREIVTFSHALELSARISHYLSRPDEAERMAKAAWARVQDAHLPEHRAHALLALLRQDAAPPMRSRNSRHPELAWALTLYRLWQARRAPVSDHELRGLLLALPESPEKRVAMMGFWLGADDQEALRRCLLALLDSRVHAHVGLVNRTASLAALHLGDATSAMAFWMRYSPASQPSSRGPRTPLDLYLAWAREFQRQGRSARPGLPFDQLRHLPESALECLIMAHRIDSQNLDVCRRMDALLDRQPGFEPLRLSLLSHLTLHQRGDWLAGLKLGLVNLQGFRLEEGLEEFMLAARQAESQGEFSKFHAALEVVDPDGLIRQALAGKQETRSPGGPLQPTGQTKAE